MNQNEDAPNKYRKASLDRKAHVDAILSSSSNKKTIVAGPGTGKTYLFRAVLADKVNCLTLTFVNALVEDLSLELCNLSDVKTLHGYARGILGSKVKVFPKLSEVIRHDATILLKADIDFDKIFHDRDDGNEHIDFYRKRKAYYDGYYGYSSIVFAAVQQLERNKDKIPTYQQVLVDEFQDFNKLEVSLIDLLAEKSPVLLAGDDDQALYAFKGASADHIRQRHSEANTDYASFSLPYCSRCTRVIVDAVNDVIATATHNGHLKGRIDKEFKYFEDEAKDKESELNPRIAYAQVHANQIPWFVEQQMNTIAAELRSPFSALIIAPTKVQCHTLIGSLRQKGFKNIEPIEQKEGKEVTLLDGLKILMSDKDSNLGWRIVARHYLRSTDFAKLLEQTTVAEPKAITKLIDKDTLKKVRGMLKILKVVAKDDEVTEDDLDSVLKEVGVDGYQAKKDVLYNEITQSSQRVGNPGVRKTPIKVTTIQSSKGLSVEHVFITYFDDRYFIKDKDKSTISDQDICNILVALTRAKKKVFLISSDKTKESTFLGWINQNRIEKLQ